MVGRSFRRPLFAGLRRVALAASLLAAPHVQAADEPPRVSASRPAGFDSLLQPQEAVSDVFMGGRLLGQARVRYSSGRVTLLDVDALVALLPDLIDPAAVRAALAAPDLDSHPGMICRANTEGERAACGIYRPAVAGLVFDDQRFRIDVYVAPRLLAVHPVAARAYLPRPQPGVSFVDQFGGSIAGSGGDVTYGLQNRAILAKGEARIRGDLSYSSSYGVSVDTLVAELDKPGLRYAAGAMWVPGIELIGRRRLVGVGVQSQIDTRLDRTLIAGTPLVVSLPQRARVDIPARWAAANLPQLRCGQSGARYRDPAQTDRTKWCFTSRKPAARRTTNGDSSPRTRRSRAWASRSSSPMAACWGRIAATRRSRSPIRRCIWQGWHGASPRTSRLDATVMGTDRTGLLELGGYWLGRAAQVRVAALASVHGDTGGVVRGQFVGRLSAELHDRRAPDLEPQR